MRVITEGFVPFRRYRTAYRIVHDRARDTSRIPLLMVHGGPGYPWWTPRADELELMASGDRPIVLYDQLGCGRSDRPRDAALWTIETFIEELATVRRALALDTVHLYGWSWGGMLVLQYLLMQPRGVQSVVLASALHSVPSYVSEARRLARDLPKPVQATMQRFEERYRPSARASEPSRPLTAKQTARRAASLRRAGRIVSHPLTQRLAAAASHIAPLRSTAYEVADVAFDQRHVCRLNPWPEQLFEMAAGANKNLYNTMWGPGETFVTGSLRDWDVTERLGEIGAPTLVITGRYDAVTPVLAREQHTKLARATQVVLESSAHTGILEEPDRHWSAVFAHLARAETVERPAATAAARTP